MRSYLTLKVTLATVCLAILAVPMFAQKGNGNGGGGSNTSPACAIVATPILSTDSASGGMNVGVFSRVGNCSSRKKRFTVTMSSMSSCAEETVFASSVITFEGGQYKLISASYAIAPDTCAGPSEVSVRVYDGSNMLAGESTVLTIQ